MVRLAAQRVTVAFSASVSDTLHTAAAVTLQFCSLLLTVLTELLAGPLLQVLPLLVASHITAAAVANVVEALTIFCWLRLTKPRMRLFWLRLVVYSVNFLMAATTSATPQLAVCRSDVLQAGVLILMNFVPFPFPVPFPYPYPYPYLHSFCYSLISLPFFCPL